MNSKNLFKYFMALSLVSVIATSCRKEKDDDRDTSSASDNALAEGTYNDVNNIADEAINGSLSSYMTTQQSNERSILSACATITNDTTVSPRVLTIDFGATNCACADGRDRRGKIIVQYTGQYRDSASTHTISFDNYFVNNNQVLGTKTVTNNGHNGSGQLNFTISVNGQIIKASGGTITWTSNRMRTWIAGEGTLPWNDDVYLITGTASGTNASGNTFSVAITSPLRKEIGYPHIVSGKLTLTPSGKPTRYVDFGPGTRDNQATVTINGNVYNITLP